MAAPRGRGSVRARDTGCVSCCETHATRMRLMMRCFFACRKRSASSQCTESPEQGCSRSAETAAQQAASERRRGRGPMAARSQWTSRLREVRRPQGRPLAWAGASRGWAGWCRRQAKQYGGRCSRSREGGSGRTCVSAILRRAGWRVRTAAGRGRRPRGPAPAQRPSRGAAGTASLALEPTSRTDMHVHASNWQRCVHASLRIRC